MQTQATIAPTRSEAVVPPLSHLRNIWPPVVVALGFGLTAAWTSLLGYGLFQIVGLAF